MAAAAGAYAGPVADSEDQAVIESRTTTALAACSGLQVSPPVQRHAVVVIDVPIRPSHAGKHATPGTHGRLDRREPRRHSDRDDSEPPISWPLHKTIKSPELRSQLLDSVSRQRHLGVDLNRDVPTTRLDNKNTFSIDPNDITGRAAQRKSRRTQKLETLLTQCRARDHLNRRRTIATEAGPETHVTHIHRNASI